MQPPKTPLSNFGFDLDHFRVDAQLSIREVAELADVSLYTLKEARFNDHRGREAQEKVKTFMRNYKMVHIETG